MPATGIAIIDFGSTPRQDASVSVVGQTAISSTSFAEAFLMLDSTADHNDYEHMMVDLNLRCSVPVNATGFTIYASSEWRLTGQFQIRWVWS